MLSSACSFRSNSPADRQLTSWDKNAAAISLMADTLMYTRVVQTYLAQPFAETTDRRPTTTPRHGDTCSV